MRPVAVALFLALGIALGGCSGGSSGTENPEAINPSARNPTDRDCASRSTGGVRWGYYPGYGCGPVPRAQTHFS